MRVTSIGHAVFATILIALGIQGLFKGDFTSVWQPVPVTGPARTALVYLCASLSLACGLGLLSRRAGGPAARVLTGYLALWLVVWRSPGVFRAPGAVLSWDACAETSAILAGAWVLYARLAGEWDRRRLAFATGDRGVRVARTLYGLALIPFGLAHFAYIPQTAALVPSWLPAPTAWAYLTGGAFLASAAGVLFRLCGRVAAAGSALQIGLFTLLVWVPIVGRAGLGASAFQWSELAISCALGASGWVVADSYQGTPWLGVDHASWRSAHLARGRGSA